MVTPGIRGSVNSDGIRYYFSVKENRRLELTKRRLP